MYKSCLAKLITLLWAATRGPVASGNIARPSSPFPNGPFTTKDSQVYGANGQRVTYAGVSWPGAERTMVPEGLQYQSIQDIVSKIKSLGMNAVRLTYASEMVDQIYDEHLRDVPVHQTFVNRLGHQNGSQVFDKILANNPSFARDITHIEVYDAIIAELSRQSIYAHLDLHISRSGWCCNPFDGNAWWNDVHFSPSNWTRALSYMAEHARKSWPNVVSMSLYNELRPPMNPDNDRNDDVLKTYHWAFWYEQMKRGADAVHRHNPDVLIFLSGLDGDVNLQPVADGTALEPSNQTFAKSAFAPGFEDKLVLELHSYDIVTSITDCASYNQEQFEQGWSAAAAAAAALVNTTRTRFPVMMTEWGFVQDHNTWRAGTYARCVQGFLHKQVPGAGWFIWSLGGSHYVRKDRHDADEPWGLLTHDWSDWRSPAFVRKGLTPLVRHTLRRGSD